MNLAGTWHEHNPVDVGWILFYVGWGAAALHPSMLTAVAAIAGTVAAWSTRRLVVVGSAALIPPAVLFVEQAIGAVTDGAAIAVTGGRPFVLVLIRTAGLARRGRRQSQRGPVPVVVRQRVRRHHRRRQRRPRPVPDAVDRTSARDERAVDCSTNRSAICSRPTTTPTRRPAVHGRRDDDRRVARARRRRRCARHRGHRRRHAGRLAASTASSDDARHHRTQAARRRAPSPSAPRHPHRPAQPVAVPRPRRARAEPGRSATRARSPCCSSTSTTSSW